MIAFSLVYNCIDAPANPQKVVLKAYPLRWPHFDICKKPLDVVPESHEMQIEIN